MNYIPAISLLVAFVIIVVVLTIKLKSEQLEKIFSGKNFLLIAAIVLFCVLSVVHLFNPQDWTADVLKVIVGVLVGASAAFTASDKKSEGTSVGEGAAQIGSNNKMAGRDINETIENMQGNIENMKSEVSQIKDSVVNQYTKIEKSLSSLSPQNDIVLDFLINTIYERGSDDMTKAMGKVINARQNQGWRFSHLSSDYQGIDGVILVFTKPSEGSQSNFSYFHGSQMERIR
jgi:gas vesicle protein